MSNLPSPEVERPEKPGRLTPKMSLRSMVAYIMELRSHGRVKTITGSDGAVRLRTQDDPPEWAERVYVELTAEDFEKLDDVAEALDWLLMQQVKAQSGGRRR